MYQIGELLAALVEKLGKERGKGHEIQTGGQCAY